MRRRGRADGGSRGRIDRSSTTQDHSRRTPGECGMEDREGASTGSTAKGQLHRVFGYYIEITKSQLHSAPDDYQRKQTIAAAAIPTPALKNTRRRSWRRRADQSARAEISDPAQGNRREAPRVRTLRAAARSTCLRLARPPRLPISQAARARRDDFLPPTRVTRRRALCDDPFVPKESIEGTRAAVI